MPVFGSGSVRFRLLAAALALSLCNVVLARHAGAQPAAPGIVPHVGGSLAGWVAAQPHVGPERLASFAAPSDRLQAFRALAAALASHDWVAARQLAASLQYRIGLIAEAGLTYVVGSDPAGLEPIVVINLQPHRDVVFQAPHAPFEAGTAEQAVLLLQAVGGRAALIAGAHRCASRSFTSCSGRTEVCGGEQAYRDSDVGHNVLTAFQGAHLAFVGAWPRSVVVSLHGMKEDSDGPKTSIIVSTGFRADDPTGQAPATRLRLAVGRVLSTAGAVVSCNLPSDAQFGFRKLCGFTNVQGRQVNGSAEACTESVDRGTGRFIHLEQDWQVLRPFAEDWPHIDRYPVARSLAGAFSSVLPQAGIR